MGSNLSSDAGHNKLKYDQCGKTQALEEELAVPAAAGATPAAAPEVAGMVALAVPATAPAPLAAAAVGPAADMPWADA